MDGISGIRIYNKINVETRFLPKNYPESLQFIVKAVNHKLSNDDWETQIDTIVIPKSLDNLPSYKHLTQLLESQRNEGGFTPGGFFDLTLTNLNTAGGGGGGGGGGDDTTGGQTTSAQASPKGVTSAQGWSRHYGNQYHLGTEPQFTNRNRVVKTITLHITAENTVTSTPSYTAAQKTVEFVGLNNGNFGGLGGIHYAVDRSGNKAVGIPEKTRSVHGNNWNQFGIGIEIQSKGRISQNSTKERDKPIIDLGFSWFGKRYYNDYTNAEIRTLKGLIQDILGRHPDIKNKGILGGKSVWKYVFNVTHGSSDANVGSPWDKRPIPGKSYVSRRPQPNYSSKWGIKIHSTGKRPGGHLDIFPSPKMIKMLVELGYTDV